MELLHVRYGRLSLIVVERFRFLDLLIGIETWVTEDHIWAVPCISYTPEQILVLFDVGGLHQISEAILIFIRIDP
jgi:hypothetical protein